MAPSGANGDGEKDAAVAAEGEGQPAPLQRLETALESASDESAAKHRRRATVALTLGMCASFFAEGLVMSPQMTAIYDIMNTRGHGKDGGPIPDYVHNRVQKLSTNIMTMSSLLNFFVLPFVGKVTDSVGRVPTFLAAITASAFGRLLVSAKPSVLTYLLCRVLAVVSMPIYLNAGTAMLGDLYGRGTQEFIEVSSRCTRVTMPLMMLATYIGGRFKQPRRAFATAGILNAIAAVVGIAGMKETLKAQDKKPMDLSPSAVNPFSFVNFYRKSKILTALGVLGILRELGIYLDVNAVYQRRKFSAWAAPEDAKMMVGMQVGYFLNTFATLPVMEYFGLQNAHRLHEWVMAAMHLLSAYAPRMELVYWGQSLRMLMAGEASLGRVMQQESELLGLGQGELQGAESNRAFLPQLAMPRIFTSLYMKFAERLPAAPFLLAAALHIFAAEVGTPWAFAQLSPSVKQAAAPKSQRAVADAPAADAPAADAPAADAPAAAA